MKQMLFAGILAMGLIGCDEDRVTIVVSPTGVVRTPEAARDAVRAVKARLVKEGRPNSPIEVVFEDGVYRLNAPLELTADDSGTDEMPVVWKTRNRGKVIFSGAAKLALRRPDPTDDRLALVRREFRSRVSVADVPGNEPIPSFLNGSHVITPSNDIPLGVFAASERLPCARWPQSGFARTMAAPSRSSFVSDSPRIKSWAREPDLWTFGCFLYDWIDQSSPVVSVDAALGSIKLADEHIARVGEGCVKALTPYYVFNAFSELDEEGEWVVDRERRRIWILKDESADVEVTRASGLVSAKRLSNVIFDGFVFEKTRKDALSLRDSTNVVLRASTIRQTCSWGVRTENCAAVRVEGCDLSDLGEGGVFLDGGDAETLAPGNNVAINNHIHHYGRVFYNYRQAIFLKGVGNRAEHNLVHHSPHAGISFSGNDHYIGWNILHDICTDNADAGAIYTWQNSWVKRGGVIEHNLIHRCGRLPNPTDTIGIYLDDYSSDATVRNNIISFASRAFRVAGQSNRIFDNVVVNCGHWFDFNPRFSQSRLPEELVKGRSRYSAGVWKSRYPDMMKYVDDPAYKEYLQFQPIGCEVSGNVHTASGPAFLMDAGAHQWKRIRDYVDFSESVAFDGISAFRDYAAFDWRAADPDADAGKVIANAEFEKMGLYDSPDRASPVVRFGAGVSRPFALAVPEEGPEVGCLIVCLKDDGGQRALQKPCATDTKGCRVIPWFKHQVEYKAWSNSSDDRWYEYEFSFVPEIDTAVEIRLGSGGRASEYRDVVLSGAAPVRPFPATTAGSEKQKATGRARIVKGVPVSVSFKARAMKSNEDQRR